MVFSDRSNDWHELPAYVSSGFEADIRIGKDATINICCASSSKLLTKRAPHVGQSLLASGLVAGAIGCTRTRHTLLDSMNRLRRYFAHPFLDGKHRARRRLNTRPAHVASRSRRPGGSYRF
jgi:hypothetical protein